jgi:hypothetical protein
VVQVLNFGNELDIYNLNGGKTPDRVAPFSPRHWG